MTVNLLGVVLAPVVTLLVFALQDGRRRARLAKEAKIAAEIVSLTPADSRMRNKIVKHYEQSIDAYLYAYRPWRWNWESLAGVILFWVAAGAFFIMAWRILLPDLKMTWLPEQTYKTLYAKDWYQPTWVGIFSALMAVAFLIRSFRNLVRFLHGGRKPPKSNQRSRDTRDSDNSVRSPTSPRQKSYSAEASLTGSGQHTATSVP